MIRVHDRYLLRSFLSSLVMALLAFIIIFIVVDVFEKIDKFVDNEATLDSVIRYNLLKIPEIVLLVLPVAMLLGCLFGLGNLARRNEILPLQNAGISTNRILLPIYLLGFLVSAAAFLLGETVLPRANVKKNEVWKMEIRKEARPSGNIRTKVNYLGRGGRHYLIGRYDARKFQMFDVVIQTFADNTLVERIDAKSGEWAGGQWSFRDGFRRTFTDEGEHAEHFDLITVPDLHETPDDFAKREKEPDEMSYKELHRFVDKTRAGGGYATKEAVEMHLKVAFPFSNAILILLGSPIATRRRRSGLAVSFALAVGLAFVYYGAIRIGQALGQNDTLAPLPAAWLGNAIFGVAAILSLSRVRN